MKKKPTRPRKNDLSRIHVPRNSAFWDTTTASPYLVFDPRTQRPQDGAILLDSGFSSSRRNSFPQSEASPPEYTPYQTALLTSAAQLHPPPYQLPSLVSSDVPPRFRRDILPLSLYPGPFLSVPSQGQTRRASDPLVYSSRFDQPLPPPPPPPPLPPPQRSNVLDLNLDPSASDLSLPLPTPAETPRGISWPEQPEPGVIVLPLFPVPYAEAEERCKAVFGSRRKGKNIWGSPTYGNSRLAICSAPQRQSRDDLSIGLKKESSKGAQPPKSAVPSGSIPERSSQSIRISSQPPGNNPFNMLGISCFLPAFRIDLNHVWLHPAVDYASFDWNAWDVRRTVFYEPSTDITRQFAIRPHQSKVTIVIRDRYTYRFPVVASSDNCISIDGCLALTVTAIVGGIHKQLMTPISEEHWSTRSFDEKHFLIRRMTERCNSSLYLLPNAYRFKILSDAMRVNVSMDEAVEVIFGQGGRQYGNKDELTILGIDYLGTKTAFRGLSIDSEPNTFVLHTE